MFYPQEVVEEIRTNNDIVDLISSYIKLTPRSSSYFGLCPFHNEKTGSFSVSPDKQIYYCFGCGASGNAIGFVMQIENFTFPEAIKFLADRIHYQLPERSFSKEAIKISETKEKLYEINVAAARFFYNNLTSEQGSVARQYLDNRQIKNKIRTKFGLGYATPKWDALLNHLLELGYDMEILNKSGLISSGKKGGYHDKFVDRLMFPIFNAQEKIVGFGGRILAKGEPKYLNSPETPVFEKSHNLYGINWARKSKQKEFILVEGYMDAISLYQSGINNAVAALGTAFNAGHANILKKYATSVIVLFDSDDAGTTATLKAISILTTSGLSVKVLQVKGAKDPDEYINKFGAEAFIRLKNIAKSHVLFQVENIKKQCDLNNTEGKIQFIDKTAKVLAKLETDVEREAYAKEIASITGISETAINNQVSRNANKQNAVASESLRRNHIKQNTIQQKGVKYAQKDIIFRIAEDFNIYKALKGHLQPEELTDVTYSNLLRIIYNFYEENRSIQIAEILNYFQETSEQKKVSEVFISSKPIEDKTILEKHINGILKQIKNHNITERFSNTSNEQELQKLFESKRNLEVLYIPVSNG